MTLEQALAVQSYVRSLGCDPHPRQLARLREAECIIRGSARNAIEQIPWPLDNGANPEGPSIATNSEPGSAAAPHSHGDA